MSPNHVPALTSADIDRFWSHVERGEGAECWLWTSWCDKDGYAKFKHQGAVYKSSRIAWTITFGDIPDGEFIIDHTCMNRRCVNPAHLELTTQEVNAWRQQGRRWSAEAQGIWREALTLPEDVPVAQVRDVLGLGKEAVNRLIVKGTLPCHPLTGRRRYVRKTDLVTFIVARAAQDAGLPVLQALIELQRKDAA